PAPELDPDPAPRPAPRVELGVDLSPAFSVVLAPGRIQGLSGGGGELRLLARAPIGATAGVGLRLLTRAAGDAGLLRSRVLFAGGYTLRLGEVEVAALAGFTLEPWRLLGGEAAGERDSPPLLLGALASASVGYRIQPARRPGLHLRVGGRLELAGSALLSGQAAELRDAATDALLVGVGGLELALGLDLALWFELPAR
ncbi:MAG: hypothetical protein KC468_19355, partial [Myxococcales bacterium]|nr:hypothetical protein [Myxococcales bacterium]